MIQKFWIALIPSRVEVRNGEVRIMEYAVHPNRYLYGGPQGAFDIAWAWYLPTENKLLAVGKRAAVLPPGVTKLRGQAIDVSLSLTPATSMATLETAYEHAEAMSVMWAEKASELKKQTDGVLRPLDRPHSGLVLPAKPRSSTWEKLRGQHANRDALSRALGGKEDP